MLYRSSGILLHITSLPAKFGIGDLGPAAYHFTDFLKASSQTYWQMLPITPPAIDSPHSPYDCISAFAADPLLISPALLYQQSLLTHKQIQNIPNFPKNHIDYKTVIPYKNKLLKAAYQSFRSKTEDEKYLKFCHDNNYWLNDFTTFAALRNHFKRAPWHTWPKEFKNRTTGYKKLLTPKLIDNINQHKFQQYIVFNQLKRLKSYCNKKSIHLIGDIPIYASYNSADIWANPHLFKLSKAKKPTVVSGVPPDDFNKTGQLWGNPIYDWQQLKKQNYSWWLDRITHNMNFFDRLRLDHFRAFVAYWQIPANHKTAAKGKWIRAPKDDFFNTLLRKFPKKVFLIEDLGHITPAVRAFIEKLDLTGTRVLQFGFGSDKATNIHAHRNHIKNCTVYTATHDTNTTLGWFKTETNEQHKKHIFATLGGKVEADKIHWAIIELAQSSTANLAITPAQDILGLDEKYRTNTPGTFSKKNWTWRFTKKQLTPEIAKQLKEITKMAKRA